MWATPAKYQTTTNGRLRSLSWLQCTGSKNAGWLANTGNESIGISWVAGERDSEGQPADDKGIGLAQNASLFKSCFNLNDHTNEV